jgi:uncharacterized protein YlxP (DUF503 family)
MGLEIAFEWFSFLKGDRKKVKNFVQKLQQKVSIL